MTDQRENRPYEVLSNINLETVAYKTNCYIAAGYTPIGGITIHNSGSKIVEYHQAVYKAPTVKMPFLG